ncbi:hypothetical protein ACIUX8_27740, partial [Pseudomonas aeruginosa]
MPSFQINDEEWDALFDEPHQLLMRIGGYFGFGSNFWTTLRVGRLGWFGAPLLRGNSELKYGVGQEPSMSPHSRRALFSKASLRMSSVEFSASCTAWWNR